MLKPQPLWRQSATLPSFSSSVGVSAPNAWVKPSPFLNAMDYTRGRSIHKKLIDSTFHQNLTIYIALALSRSAASVLRGTEIHSQRETVEHMSRDLPSIFMAYFGARLLLKSLTVWLFKNDKHKMLHLPDEALNRGTTWWDRLKNNANYIFKGKMITSEEITGLKHQTIDSFKQIAKDNSKTLGIEDFKPILKYFERLKFKRNAVNFAGTLINLLLMGLLIPYVNIVLTQAYAEKYHARLVQAHISGS